MSSKQLFFKNHLMTACLAAVFAFGLAACSSSGSDTPPAEPETEEKPMPEPEPEPQALDIPDGGDLDLAFILGLLGLGAEDGATSTLDIAAGQSETRGNVTFTCPESATDGCTVTFTNEAGQVQVSELGGVTASVPPIPPRDPAEVGVPPVADRDDPDISGTLSVKVTRGAIPKTAGATAPDAAFDIGHRSYAANGEGGTTLVQGAVWASAVGDLTGDGTDPDATDIDPDRFVEAAVGVYVVTNIEPATYRDFFEKYPASGGKDANRYYTVPANANPSLLETVNDTDNDGIGDDFLTDSGPVNGTFDGVAGTFRCHSGPCSITVTDNLNPLTPELKRAARVKGVIHFTPNANDDAFDDVKDPDYLTLGAWSHTVNGAVIEATADYGFSQALTDEGRSMLTRRGETGPESASYTGFAVGARYKEGLDDQGRLTEETDLYGTTVSLTATFAPQNQGGDTLEGTIDAPSGITGAPAVALAKTALSANFTARGLAGSSGADRFDGTWAAEFVGDGTSIGGTYDVSRGDDAENNLERYTGAFGAIEE